MVACGGGNGDNNGNVHIVTVPEEIDEMVLNELLPESDMGSPTKIFRYPTALKKGDTVNVAFSSEDEDEALPAAAAGEDTTLIFTAEEDTYFYFVDFFDGYFYAHAVAYIFIRASDGDVTRIEGEWWPLVNGKEVFYTKAQSEDETDILASYPEVWDEVEEVTTSDLNYYDQQDIQESGHIFEDIIKQDNGSAGDVLIINNIKPDDKVRDEGDTAVKQAEDALGRTHKIVKKFDIKDKPDLTDKDILEWLKKYGTLKGDGKTPDPAFAGRNLTISIVSHGSGSSGGDLAIGSSKTRLSSTELRNAVKKLKDRGIRVKLIILACYSGQLILQSRNIVNIGITSSGSQVTSARDITELRTKSKGGKTIKDTNDDTDEGPEFTSGFWEDYNEILDRLEKDKELKAWFDRLIETANKQGADIDEAELIIYPSYDSAIEKDITAQTKYSYLFLMNGEKTEKIVTTTPRRFPASLPDILGEDKDKRGTPGKGSFDWIEILTGQNNKTVPVCGDGVKDLGEECDKDTETGKTDLGGKTCKDIFPFKSGTLQCNDDCTFDTSRCSAVDTEALKAFLNSFVGLINHNQEEASFTIQGRVMGNSSEASAAMPLSGAMVTLERTDSDLIEDGSRETKTVITDAKGDFKTSFNVFYVGNYTISVANITGENIEYDPTLNQVSATLDCEVEPGVETGTCN